MNYQKPRLNNYEKQSFLELWIYSRDQLYLSNPRTFMINLYSMKTTLSQLFQPESDHQICISSLPGDLTDLECLTIASRVL